MIYFQIYHTLRTPAIGDAALGLKPVYSRPDDLRGLLADVMVLVPRLILGLGVGRPVAVGLEGGLGGGDGIEEGLGVLLGLAGFPEDFDGLSGGVGDGVQTPNHRLTLLVFPALLELSESGLGDIGGDGIRIGDELTIDAGLDFRSDIHGVMQF